uniref:Uncharacterized protein n=1 Tax=Anguilla anguilla TaxID=7936 RepID=A0A0E9QX56_ANGAN
MYIFITLLKIYLYNTIQKMIDMSNCKI